MTRPTRTTATLILAALCALCSAEAALACTCAPTTAKQARKRAEAVFAGTVLDTHRELKAGGGVEWRVRLRVERYWKGEVGEEVVVYTGGGCESAFEAGKEYLVFAHREQGRGRLSTDVCARTGPLALAGEDVAKLGKAKQPARRGS